MYSFSFSLSSSILSITKLPFSLVIVCFEHCHSEFQFFRSLSLPFIFDYLSPLLPTFLQVCFVLFTHPETRLEFVTCSSTSFYFINFGLFSLLPFVSLQVLTGNRSLHTLVALSLSFTFSLSFSSPRLPSFLSHFLSLNFIFSF